MTNKNFIKILAMIALTCVFVACGGAEVSFAPSARADEPTSGSAGTAGTSAGACMCAPGAKGDAGLQGPAGAQGPAGKDGTSAVCVNDLNSCPPGVPGAKGDAGPAGPQGPAGAKGDLGMSGTNGAVGPQGPAGPMGTQGPQGAAGPQGPAGKDGKNGQDGAGITKSNLYTRTTALSAGVAIALCDDDNDIALTGTCQGVNVFWSQIGVYQPINTDAQSGWECRNSNVGGNPVGATVVCLVVP